MMIIPNVLSLVNRFKLTSRSRLRSSSILNMNSSPKTMFDKIWAQHLVDDGEDSSLIYIDRHLVHEVTSPQAFEGLRTSGRKVRRPDCTLVTVDHNIPTSTRDGFTSINDFIKEPDSRTQVLALEDNVKAFGLTYYGMNDPRQGIVHIIGPEQGFTLPGTTVVCGDSHTSTHGAFGSLAFGIGTSEVEHVLATQTLVQKQAKNMKVEIRGSLHPGVKSKDIVLHIIGEIGTAGGTGHVIEFCGDAIQSLSMEARMSICNMAIEGGARAGMIAPDDITFGYLKGRPMVPTGEQWNNAVDYWRSLKTDEGAKFDKEVIIDAKDILPTVTWGTSPQDAVSINGLVPDPAQCSDPARSASMQRSLDYMGLTPGTPVDGLKVDKVFIGSCTNARIEDVREAAAIAKGKKVADHVYAMVVPGSGLVKLQAEEEGLDKILIEAGFDWREPGCSMCLAMNPDKLGPQERCASTSNRNFEGRQGNGGRTHLVSPAMAAAAAVTGALTDVRKVSVSDLSEPTDTTFLNMIQAIESNTPAIQASGNTATLVDIDSSKGEDVSISDPSKQFISVKSIAASLPIQNIDTDMIIPKQFLKTIKRSGLGKSAFYEMRYDEAGNERDDFILNQKPYRHAQILVTGDNFGCGSSREHAPWALNDFGVKCIISTSFADIFYNNCFKNGMLPLVLPRDQVDSLMADCDKGLEIEVDLGSQQITRSDGTVYSFDIDPFRKDCLIRGLDDIGLTMQKEEMIKQYENHRSSEEPWIDNAAQQFV